MIRIATILALLLAAVSAVAQNQYFVSNSGNNANSGTSTGLPWQTISFAIAHANLTGGAVINVAQGTYTESLSCGGNQPVVCMNRSGPSITQRFVLQCSADWSVPSSSGCLLRNGGTNGGIEVTANNVDVIGFDYSNSAAGFGIHVQTAGVNSAHLIHNYLHDIGQTSSGGCPLAGGILAYNTTDLQIIDNRISNFGLQSNAPRNGGTCNFSHGIYDGSPNSIVENNVIIQAITYGIQIYANPCGVVVSNNTVDQPGKGAIVLGGGSCSPQGHITINNNILESGTVAAITLGAGGTAPCGASSRIKITNNLIASGAITQGNQNGCTDISGTVTEAPTTTFTGYSSTSTTNSYVPKSSSLAVGKGVAPPSCVSGALVSPCVPSTDFLSNPRPNPPAIGAYEPTGGGGGSPVPQASPTALSFSNVLVATDSAIQTSTISNSGSASYSITSETISDGNFLFGGIGTCVVGQVIAPGVSCTVSVKFHPTSTGAKSGTLNVGTSASPLVISLSGTGTAPIVSISPPSLAFGNQQLGTTSAVMTVTVTNTGTGALTNIVVTLQ